MRALMSGAVPVWTRAGPATQRMRRPSAFTALICSATWSSSSPLGFSDERSELMNANALLSSPRGRSSGNARMPRPDTTTLMPFLISPIGTVRALSPSTTIPQSISGWVTRNHLPSMRMSVSKFVEE